MWRLIKFLFTGYWNEHEHEWEILNKTKIYNADSIEYDIPVRIEYILQCKKCGKLKKTKG